MKCKEASKSRWASSKSGSYGKGVLNTFDDPYRTERVGLLGEAAYGLFIGRPEDTDFSYIQGGDTADFKHGKFKVDMKCASRNSGKVLVAKFANSKEYKVDKDIYVAGYMVSDTGEVASVELVGWCYKAQVLKSPVEKGKGDWYNYVLYYDKLKPMDELLGLVKALSPPKKTERDEFIEDYRSRENGIRKDFCAA